MSATALPFRPLLPVAGECFKRQPLWATTGLLMLLLAAVTALGLAVDPRTLYGVSVWSKPLKFELSLAVYYLTLAWFVPLLPAATLAGWRGSLLLAVPVVAGALEILYISLQAALGQPSHFNQSTPWHALAYSLMGVGAVLLVLVCGWLGLAVLREQRRTGPTAYGLGVGLGLMLSCLLGGGFGGYLASQTGHWVGGAASDAGGAWLFSWARDGGDLRVAHFFGMHVMQALPLLGFAAMALPRRAGLGLVIGGALAYSAFALWVFIEAITGQPFFLIGH